jgi:hypothetical protein
MFVHWGPASLSGKEISWARIGHPHDGRGHESVPAEEYDILYRRFNPVKFDADAWMRLAQEAGMKYVVFTAKHHDGFSLWPTRLRADYSESIYGTRGGPYRNGEWGGATHRGNIIYLHVFDWVDDALRLPPLKATVLRAVALTGGSARCVQTPAGLSVSRQGAARATGASVIKLELDGPAAAELTNGQPIAVPEPAALALDSPKNHQVFQRRSATEGIVRISGRCPVGTEKVEFRLDGEWRPAVLDARDGGFKADLKAAAGGWLECRVRAIGKGRLLASAEVPRVGVGEIFVVAGQSNSANHGEEKQLVKSGLVTSFDGKTWRPAHDPQPGASGTGGSFMPPFGDAVAGRLRVPIGIVACGVGATSVREWLPAGTRFPNPPTIEKRVTPVPDGTWESRGEAFAMLTERMKQLGPQGFRAVLWHQGESDANQKDPTRTLPGALYRQYLEQVIRNSRREIGWEAPWFVAQVSYHTPDDPRSEDIRAAQAALWSSGVALAGPDSDALIGELRERNGIGVHFSRHGLIRHGEAWAAKVLPWLEAQLKP